MVYERETHLRLLSGVGGIDILLLERTMILEPQLMS